MDYYSPAQRLSMSLLLVWLRKTLPYALIQLNCTISRNLSIQPRSKGCVNLKPAGAVFTQPFNQIKSEPEIDLLHWCMNTHQVHAHPLQVHVVCGQLTHGGGELDLHLDLRAQLLYLAPRLVVLPPHQLDDGGGEGEADEDVEVADDEVRLGQLNVCKMNILLAAVLYLVYA